MFMKKTLLFLLLLTTALVVNSQTSIVLPDQHDRTPINIDNLKEPITDFIIKHYAGFIIKQATRIVKNNIITYEIILVQWTTTDTLIYDQNYNLVREIVQKEDSIKPGQRE